MTPNATQPTAQPPVATTSTFWKKVDAVCGTIFFVTVFGGGVFLPIAFFINGVINR